MSVISIQYHASSPSRYTVTSHKMFFITFVTTRKTLLKYAIEDIPTDDTIQKSVDDTQH